MIDSPRVQDKKSVSEEINNNLKFSVSLFTAGFHILGLSSSSGYSITRCGSEHADWESSEDVRLVEEPGQLTAQC